MDGDKPGPGRPAFKATAGLKKQVSVALAGGMTHDEVCAALGITKPTLYKYFGEELDESAAKRRFEVLNALYRAAVGGNVSACKAFLEDLVPAPKLVPQPIPQAEKAPALGKKLQADADATKAHVGTDWADDLRPRSRAVN